MTNLVDKRIAFVPAGGTQFVWLGLSGDWTISNGLDPNVNCAVIPYTERAKLPTNLVDVVGTIFFWGRVDPLSGDPPEHALGNIWLVDCVVDKFGNDWTDADGAPKKALTYKLSFADHRHAFRAPRGGRLMQGIGNPDPLGDATLINNKPLIESCLSAMGVSASVPTGVNDVEPRRQLEWFGAHAPTELGELLQHVGYIYSPYSGGGALIQRLGFGDLPTIPSGRLISDITASSVSRLPRCVVVTSAPNAEARTYTDAASGDNVPKWEYVVQDPANDYKWREISTVTALGTNPKQELNRGFPTAAEKDRKLLGEQLYKVIRLKNDRYNSLQCPVLRDVLFPDGRIDQPHLVATVAVQDVDSAWVNRSTRLNATTIDGVGNLLSFDTRLGTVEGDERGDLDPFFTPITAADLKPTFTVEDFTPTDLKYISVFGYEIGLSGLSPISESAARDRLTGYRPNVSILDVEELRVVHLNDATNNRSTLESRAETMASALLFEAANLRTIEVTGFLPCEVDGRITEVRYSQDGYRTTIIRDGFACPSIAGRSTSSGGSSGRHSGPSDSPLHQQGRSHPAAKRRAMSGQIKTGGSMARTPAAPAAKTPVASTGFRIGLAKIGDNYTGQPGRTKGTTISGRVDKAASGEYELANVGSAGTTDDTVLYGLGHLPIPLARGQVALTLYGPTKADGKLIGVAVPTSPLYQVKVVKSGGTIGTRTTASTWVYTVKTLDLATFATSVPLYKTRPNGKINYAPDNSIAFAFYNGDALYLWDVNESFGTTSCTP